jgi:hypothetical protein
LANPECHAEGWIARASRRRLPDQARLRRKSQASRQPISLCREHNFGSRQLIKPTSFLSEKPFSRCTIAKNT